MIRAARALPLLLVLPALLTACGTEKARSGPEPAASGSASVTSRTAPAASTSAPAAAGSSQDPASAAPGKTEMDERLRALGIAPELVYVTEVPGFTLAQQSIGVNGDDGFSVAYWAKDGAVLHLYAERGSAADCPQDHVCRAPVKGQVVRLYGEKVAPDVLRRAADALHRPTPGELVPLLPSPRTATAPVQRGDLPPNGDGAPDNSVPGSS
ncbi:membrane lipoprotein [Streptomyces sp. CSDS2]|uniref:membrane lipoprotein n=1 Tax=Streptomyces sp. CSDS2 TaxID=3055051 RepID=UPI0025B01425|nr:membrane lipoprotein [Streptomyces sp. CSDS2]MDN3260477.1 membrane lipoprotein [Streptomyces sp. CSDS2]